MGVQKGVQKGVQMGVQKGIQKGSKWGSRMGGPCFVPTPSCPLGHPKQNNIELSCFVLDVPVGSLRSSKVVFG